MIRRAGFLPHAIRQTMFCATFAATLHAQAVSPPNWVLYMAVFHHVNNQGAFAEHLDKVGKKTGNGVRQQIRNKARLTEHEDTLLKTAAKTFGRANAAFLKRRGQLLEARRNAKSQPDKESLSAEIKEAEEQYTNLILQLVAELQQGFGPARFQAFDSYVRQNIAPSVVYRPLQKVK